jgi:glycosyltransferase involved in cell wall biosynthesis
MRILHIVHQYFPEHVGGTEHYCRSLALAQLQAGHEVRIFARRYGAGQRLEQKEIDGIQVHLATNGPFTPLGRFRSTLRDPFLAACLSSTVREAKPELVHIQHLMGLPVESAAGLKTVAPLVATLHDYWWVCANAQLITDYSQKVCGGPNRWLNCARCGLARSGAGGAWPLALLVAPVFAYRAHALRRLAPAMAAWIAPTRFVGDWYVANGHPAKRMHVIGHGIELPPDGLQRAKAPTRGEGARRFAYVGGLSPQKGIHILVDAFNELPPSTSLTIAGDETVFPEYCAELRRRARHPGIRFAGRLERTEVWQTLASVDAVVVPSLWYETASLVVQEAFAVGTPVVAAEHGALAERVQHEVDGLLVPPGDTSALRRALRRMMEENNLMEQLVAGIRPVLSIAEHAQRVERVYRDVLAEAGRDQGRFTGTP